VIVCIHALHQIDQAPQTGHLRVSLGQGLGEAVEPFPRLVLLAVVEQARDLVRRCSREEDPRRSGPGGTMLSELQRS